MVDALLPSGTPVYRRSVGILLLNHFHEVLAGERIPKAGEPCCPVVWQFPQGGCNTREALRSAARRELGEETGTRRGDTAYLTTLPEATEYLIPPDRRTRGFDGQRHTWVVLRYLPREGLPDLRRATEQEFRTLRWVPPRWIMQNTPAERQVVYEKVLVQLEHFLARTPAKP